MPQENSERGTEGLILREDLTRLVPTIVDVVLQWSMPEVAGEDKTSDGVPSEAQRSRRDPSTSHSEQ